MLPAEVKKRRDKTPEQALAALMRLCARAEKSESDARRLMRGWGLAERDAEQVLGKLVRDRFIDDALQRKGIRRELIDAALAQAEGADMGERLAQMLARKARTVRAATPYELKTKLIRYGLSLGYEYEAVLEAASAMVRETDTCEDF